jgi:hypothetical protein
MGVESIIDALDKSQPDDEGCEHCGCTLWPLTLPEPFDITVVRQGNTERTYLTCKNKECPE